MKDKFSKSSYFVCALVLIGVIIIPLFYSYFYLGAFWDPYSRLEKVPVAVVNNDRGATINEEERNVGQELCDKLKEEADLKFIFTDEADAKSGSEGDKYYAMIVIPADFSKNIASSSTTKKTVATITYSPNEKRNYLASQILNRAVLEMEESIRASVDKEIVKELSDNLNSVPDQMTKLQDGVNDLYQGSKKLNKGADQLDSGITTFNSKFNKYENGVAKVKAGSGSLKGGIKSLDSGISELKSGADKLTKSTENIGKITKGAQNLASGTKTLSESLNTYTAGVDSLIDNASSTSEFLKNYATSVNPSIMKDPVFAGFISKLSRPENASNIKTLQAANSKIKQASKQLAGGATSLASGTGNLTKLNTGLKSFSNGLTKVKSGSSKLVKGANTLDSGISDLKSATGKLGDATKDMSEGASALSKGSDDLKDGIATAKKEIDKSISDTNNDLKALDGLADFAEEPVTIEQKNITAVPNYGTAFAPYFLSLSLWVGALMIFFGIYLDSDEKFKILSRSSEKKIARSFIYLLIGLVQAVVLSLVVNFGLGLHVENLALFISACCLVSMTFIAIVQFLLVNFKDVGKFLSLLFLILQLTSCGGTFPMETVPKFFNALYKYMPMTYSVQLFKQVISDTTMNKVISNSLILWAILIVFMTLTIIMAILRKVNKTLKAEPAV